MNTAEILKIHNAWRRGDDTRTQDELGFSVTDIGRAIDDAVRAIAERDQLRAELAQERERVKVLTENLTNARDILQSMYEDPTVLNAYKSHYDILDIAAYDAALSAGEGGE